MRDATTSLLDRLGVSDAGAIDWSSVVDRFYKDPETRRILKPIPSQERRGFLAEFGRKIYRYNLGNYTTEFHYNSDPVIESGQLPGFRDQREDHVAFLLAFLSDLIDLSTRELAECHLGETEVTIHGLEHLERHLNRRGVVLTSVHQSHIGYSLDPLLAMGFSAAIVRGMGEENVEPISPMLDTWSSSVTSIPASRSGGVKVMRHLRDGGVLGVYNDFLFPSARADKGFLFGAPVPISTTLLRIAKRVGAAIVPMTIARQLPLEGNKVEIHFFSALPSSLSGGDESVASLAMEVSLATECLIRRFPIQWRLWNTLRMRWDRGKEL